MAVVDLSGSTADISDHALEVVGLKQKLAFAEEKIQLLESETRQSHIRDEYAAQAKLDADADATSKVVAAAAASILHGEEVIRLK